MNGEECVRAIRMGTTDRFKMNAPRTTVATSWEHGFPCGRLAVCDTRVPRAPRASFSGRVYAEIRSL